MVSQTLLSTAHQVIYERIDPLRVGVLLRGSSTALMRQHGVFQTLGRRTAWMPESAGSQAEAVFLHVLDLG